MKKSKIPRIVRAYLLMLGLTVGFIFGGIVFLIPVVFGWEIAGSVIAWAILTFVGYVSWFLTQRKFRELLIEWGVIELAD